MPQTELTAVTTRALLSFLLRSREPIIRPDPVDGALDLRFGLTYRVTCLVLFIISCAMVAFGLFAFSGDPPRQLMASAILGPICLAMSYGIYDAFLVSLRASDHGLEIQRLLLGRRVLPWLELRSVSYSTLGNWYRFRSTQGWSIRVSIYRSGLYSFSRLVSRHIGHTPARLTPPGFYDHTAA